VELIPADMRDSDTLSTFLNAIDAYNFYHHSLYSILNFDWLIYLQITACK
jgi:hypothetical protein